MQKILRTFQSTIAPDNDHPFLKGPFQPAMEEWVADTDSMKVCPDCCGWQTIQSSLSLETEHLCHRCNGKGLIDPEMDGDAKANQVH